MKLCLILALSGLLPFAWVNAGDFAYNQSRLNSKWGVIKLVLPLKIPPGTFWNPLKRAEPKELTEEIGVIVECGHLRESYILFIDLKIPHIYAVALVDVFYSPADFLFDWHVDWHVTFWTYESGVPIESETCEFPYDIYLKSVKLCNEDKV